MPGTTPPTSQLDWLSSTTAMIVLFWSRAMRDLLKSFGWGIAALHRLHAATKLPCPCRPPHSISWSPHAGASYRLLNAGAVTARGRKINDRFTPGDNAQLERRGVSNVRSTLTDTANHTGVG